MRSWNPSVTRTPKEYVLAQRGGYGTMHLPFTQAMTLAQAKKKQGEYEKIYKLVRYEDLKGGQDE